MSVAAMLAVALLASMPEQPTGSEVAWSVPNYDATLVAEQTAREGGCHLQVRRDTDKSVLWEKDGCFGGKSDPHLLSGDGMSLVVMASYPTLPSEDKNAWRTVPVIWLFQKGELVESGVAGQLVKDPSELRLGVKHFNWLQGVLKVPGLPPKTNKDGTAGELDTVDNQHLTFTFTSLKLKPLPPLKTGKHHKRRH